LSTSTLKRAEVSSDEHGSHFLGGQAAMIVVDDDDINRRDNLVLVLLWIGKRNDEVGANEYEQVKDSNNRLRAMVDTLVF
jgi:hypothetical protein